MKKPYLSIIIPAYNSAMVLPTLFDSIFASIPKNFEVILVDDGSTDGTREVVKKFKKVRYFYIENSGPGKARDFGAQKAEGEILVFFDADVILYPNTLKEIIKSFENKKTMVITGIWDKKQRRRDFFPRYKALRDWSYWFNEDSKGYSYMFSTRVAAIKKKVFWELGGFVVEKGPNALEDLDFTYRLSRNYTVEFASGVRVQHEFGGAQEMLIKFFKRSFKYAKLFLHYRQFSRSGYTPVETIAGLTAVFVLISFIASFWIPSMLYVTLLLFLIYIYLQRKFLSFVLSEEGLIFTMKSIVAGLIVHLVVYSGAILSVLHSFILIVKKKVFFFAKRS